MLQLALQDGRTIKRIVNIYVETEEELEEFISKTRLAYKNNHSGKPLVCETWKDVTSEKKIRENELVS